LGRWLQRDPIEYNAGDTNLYRFVFNSPTNYTDPTGEVVAQAAIGCGVGAGLSVAIAYFFEEQRCFGDLVEAGLRGCAQGALAGVLMHLGGGLLLSGFSSVLAGQGGRAAGNVVGGRPITTGLGRWGDMAWDFAIGVVSFGAAAGWTRLRAPRPTPTPRASNGSQVGLAPQRGPVHIDIGGEGRYPGAINVNPNTTTSTTGTAGRPIPNLVQATGERLPFANQAAQIVTIENTPISQATASQVARVIRPGGEIRLVSPADYARTAHQRVIQAVPQGSTVTQTTVGTGDAAMTTTIIRVPGN